MSADNTIFIVEFPQEDGTRKYRVIHAQAAENMRNFETPSHYFSRIIQGREEMCPEYNSMAEARTAANEMEIDSGHAEYGIHVCSCPEQIPISKNKLSGDQV